MFARLVIRPLTAGLLVLAAAAPAAPTVQADPAWHAPAPARLDYEVSGKTKGIGYPAQATLTWAPEGDRYRATLSLRALLVGERVQTSQGALTGRGLQPTRFEDRARRERWLALDWPDANAAGTGRHDGGETLPPLPVGTQDRLSVFVQLGGWLGTPPPSVGQRWRVPVAGTRQLEHWTFAATARETLTLPAGRYETVRVERLPDGEHRLGVTLWYSPALPGLPVRILLQHDNGDRVDQRLRAAHPATP